MKFTLAKLLNSFGLIIGIIGVVIIFIWGPPQPRLEPGVSLGISGNTVINSKGKTVNDVNAARDKKAQKYKRNSRLGLVFVFIGFIIQLIAIWIPDKDLRKIRFKENSNQFNE